MAETETITDSEGTRISFNSRTREITKTVDRNGFIFNSEDKKVGHIDEDFL